MAYLTLIKLRCLCVFFHCKWCILQCCKQSLQVACVYLPSVLHCLDLCWSCWRRSQQVDGLSFSESQNCLPQSPAAERDKDCQLRYSAVWAKGGETPAGVDVKQLFYIVKEKKLFIDSTLYISNMNIEHILSRDESGSYCNCCAPHFSLHTSTSRRGKYQSAWASVCLRYVAMIITSFCLPRTLSAGLNIYHMRTSQHMNQKSNSWLTCCYSAL